MNAMNLFRFYGYAPKKTADEGCFAIQFKEALSDTDRSEAEDELFDCFDVVEWSESGVGWCYSSVPPSPVDVTSVAVRLHYRFAVSDIVNHYARAASFHVWERSSRGQKNWPAPELLLPKGQSYYAVGAAPPESKRSSRGANSQQRRTSRSATSSSAPRSAASRQPVAQPSAEPSTVQFERTQREEANRRPSERVDTTTNHTWRFINVLVQTMQIELARGSTIHDMTTDMNGVYSSNMTGEELYEFLMEHPAVTEVFSDASRLQALLNVW